MAAQDLVTLEYVRTALELDDAETGRDELIAQLITPASDAVISEVNRELAPITEDDTRRLRVDETRRLKDGTILGSLAPYDLASATTVVLNPEQDDPTELAFLTDYLLDPEPAKFGVYTVLRLSAAFAVQSTTLSTWGFFYVDITGDWGFPEIPEVARRATALTIDSWMNRGTSQIALAPKEQPDVRPIVLASYGIPRDVKDILGPLYRQKAF